MKGHQTPVIFSIFPSLVVFFVITNALLCAHAAPSGQKLSGTLPGQIPLTLEALQEHRTLAENLQEMTPDRKKNLLEQFDRAILFVTARNTAETASKDLSKLIQAAPERIPTLKKTLLKPGFEKDARTEEVLSRIPIEALEQQLHQEEAGIVRAQTRLIDLNNRILSEQADFQQIPDIIHADTERLKVLQGEMEKLQTVPAVELFDKIRVTVLAAEKEKLEAEIKLNEQKRQSHHLLLELAGLEKELARKQLQFHEKELEKLKTAIAAHRVQDAVQDREDAVEAADAVALLPGAVQEQFQINLRLSSELERLGNEESRLLTKSAEYKSQLKQISDTFETAQKRVEMDLLTETIGLALRNQRRHLPSESVFSEDSKFNRVRISQVSEHQFQLEARINEIADPAAYTDYLMMTDLNFLSAAEKKRLSPRIRKLAAQRTLLIQKITAAQDRLIRLIQEIEFTKKQILSLSETFGSLLDKHLLWIRSSKPLTLEEIREISQNSALFLTPRRLSELRRMFSTSIKTTPVNWGIGSLAFLCLVLLARWARKTLPETAQSKDRHSLKQTFKAIGLGISNAAFLPFLLIFPITQIQPLHRILSGTTPDTVWMDSAIILCFWIFIYQLFRPESPAIRYFGWNERLGSTIRKSLFWLITAEMVCFLILALSSKLVLPGIQNPFEIPVIIFQSCALLAFTVAITGSESGIFASVGEKKSQSILYRFRYLWRFLLCLMPVCILWLAAAGFYFSALEIRTLLHQSVALFFFLLFADSTGRRLLLLARKKIAFKKAMNTPDRKKGKDTADIMDHIVKLSDIDSQTRSLLKLGVSVAALAGIWLIWEPVLPALGILNDIQFWQYTAMADGVEKSFPITLADISIAILVIAVTVMAVRNMPGFLEMLVLDRLHMDPGAKYAYTTISRYLIIATGTFAALNSIGVRWSNLQWLIAALSVGLGFGLQEVVANFISGLIVLFERPFRLGDTITVGDVTGTVTRIQIRATTIMDWDRKELIVPNKEFITGRLVNWSLSDQIVRIKIPVGIAYGSDTQLAEDLMMDAARKNSLVLQNPKPNVVFLRFGDNSLEYEVRVFIKDIDDWIPMLHNINRAIDEAFRKHDISISFPQRDVHLDAASPLPVRLMNPRDAEC